MIKKLISMLLENDDVIELIELKFGCPENAGLHQHVKPCDGYISTKETCKDCWKNRLYEELIKVENAENDTKENRESYGRRI